MAAPKGYSSTQIRLHWIVGALILFQLIYGEAMGEPWDAVTDGRVPVMSTWVWAHILVGGAVLALVVWRAALRRMRGVPEVPHSDNALMTKAAEWGHLALYALMVLTPISGLVAWYGGVEIAGEVHGWFKPALIVLIAGHAAAALYHQFWLKDGLLLRMQRPLD